MSKDITVCIPVYNGEKTIEAAIKSILKAELINYEILISDNASKDRSKKICLDLKKLFPQLINYHQNIKNLGFAENYKKCIEKAQGKYLFFIGDDDVLMPKAINILKSVLDEKPDVGLVCSDIYTFRDNPEKITKKLIYFDHQKKVFKRGKDSLANWVFNSVLGSVGGCLIRSSDAKKFYRFIPSKSLVPQFHLSCNIAVYKNIGHYPVFSFAQNNTDNVNQIANQQYLSLDIVKEIILLIDDLSKTNEKINHEKKIEVRKQMLRAYSQALMYNLVSYKSIGSLSVVFNLIKLLIKINKQIIFDPKFLFFSSVSLLIPKFLLRRLLFIYRRKTF